MCLQVEVIKLLIELRDIVKVFKLVIICFHLLHNLVNESHYYLLKVDKSLTLLLLQLNIHYPFEKRSPEWNLSPIV